MSTHNIAAAEAFIARALSMVGKAKEQAVRDNLTSHLRLVFPDKKWWVEEHIAVCERKLRYSVSAHNKQGFVDNLVGCTVIEYEPDITVPGVRDHGEQQVREYCAGLLQDGVKQDLVIGVLSDTVRWRAYAVTGFHATTGTAGTATIDADSITLGLIEELTLTASDAPNAQLLVKFLRTYLGRQGSRRLSAENIADDLGLQSKFFQANDAKLRAVVRAQLAARPRYAAVLTQLWQRFVGFVSASKDPVAFDPDSYAAELYVLTLAKLVLANVLSGKALASDDSELANILDGQYFEQHHIRNLVEYDYFGWLNEPGAVDPLLPIARQIQADVSAYDYRSPPAGDLFGRFLLQLPSAQQRILLGQQWTPSWLAEKMVRWVTANLPVGVPPQLLDMCCGSGTMVVAALRQQSALLDKQSVSARVRYERLCAVVTGFDIDPLAVMLAKASWLLAVRDALEPLTDIESVFIPIYNADSLMRVTGVSDAIDSELKAGRVVLEFADKTVQLPAFLVGPDFERHFDALLDASYPFALALAESGAVAASEDVVDIVERCELTTGAGLGVERAEAVHTFTAQFIDTVRQLQVERRNGIWAFVLKNSYRPALVAGKFNGLVSNPPWMSLSRLADNPYAVFLKKKASEFAVSPRASSAHHTELATVFLLHAVERYLADGAACACIVPETVLNGTHQVNFRKGRFLTASRPVPLEVNAIWHVDDSAFDTNRAVVLCGHRTPDAEPLEGAIPGLSIGPAVDEPVAFQVTKTAGQLIWSEFKPEYLPTGAADSRFRQGADVFPRRLWFHRLDPAGGGAYRVHRLEKSDPKYYLVSDEKKADARNFVAPAKRVLSRYFQQALLSKHLAAFRVCEPDQLLLPIKRLAGGGWAALKDNEIDRDADFKAVTRACLKRFAAVQGLPATAEAVLSYVNSPRGKLLQQGFNAADILVVYGAGGAELCAGLVRSPSTRLIIDQTLYWARVNNETEAFYLLGMLNSYQVNAAIKPFQPRGKMTERHIHKLPLIFIPRFDPADGCHLAVAEATQVLQAEFDVRGSEIAPDLAPRSALPVRRRKVREFVQSLDAYEAYLHACESVLESA